MAASTEVLIGGHSAEYVLIRPISRSHPGLFDAWDGNWIDCEIQAAVGGFRAAFHADLRSEEFLTLQQELEVLTRVLDATARFVTMEGQLALVFAGDGKGLVRVTGQAVDAAGTGNRLEFAFEIDQTYLPPICRSLEDLLAAFPVNASPSA